MNTIRPLSYMESRMHLLQSMFQGTTQGGLTIRFKGNLNLEEFQKSISSVKHQYDILNAIIIEKDEQHYFAHQDDKSLPLKIIQGENDNSWLDILQREIMVPLEAASQLWRMVLITPKDNEENVYDLLLIVHHSIMDGTAADYFINAIFECYSKKNSSELLNSNSRSIPDAAETALPKPLQLSWEEFVELQKQAAADQGKIVPTEYIQKSPIEERNTKIVPLAIDKNECEDLEFYCKQHNITLNSYVSAALALSVEENAPERQHFALYTAFSLRRLCKRVLNDDDIGCYMSVVPTFHDFSSECSDLKGIAVSHQNMLSKSILQYAKHPSEVNINTMKDSLQPLEDMQHFVHDMGITYGDSSVKAEYGDIRLIHMYPSVNRALGNLAVVVHSVKFNDALYSTINYTMPLQDTDWADKVSNRFHNILKNPPVS